MLDSKWLQDAPEPVVDLFSQVEITILKDMARRVTKYDYFIPAAQHQRKILEAVGESRKAITTALSGITGESERAIRELITEAGNRTIESDTKYYKAAEIYAANKVDEAALNAVLRSGLRQTLGEFKNITRTTVQAGGNQLYNVLNSAWLQVSTGAFDAETAIKNAVKQLAASGLNAVDYPSGKHDTLEVAVRRAVLTGANQTALKIQDEYAEELGCDLVETTAHAGARPSHAVWQGKVFSRSGKSTKYPSFRAATGYGTVTGLGGVNCRHSYGPYVEGAPRVWTDDQLKKLDEKSITYNGEKLTEYEASQRQRAIERQIRKWKRAEALDVDGASEKVAQWQKTQRDFIRQTGLRRQYSREQVSVSSELVKTTESLNRKIVNKYGQTVVFDSRMDDEKWSESKKLISYLATEYETRLTAVGVGSHGSAGSVDMGGAMKLSSTARNVVLHEFAHSVSTEALTKYGVVDDSEFWKEVRSIRREYKRNVGDDTSRWISSYEHSQKSIDEFMAEAFTHAKMKEMGFEIPEKYGNDFTYSNMVLSIVNKYFKKR